MRGIAVIVAIGLTLAATGDAVSYTGVRMIDGGAVPFRVHGDPLVVPPVAVPGSFAAVGPHTLASAWCGDETAVDDTVHETGSLADPKIKVIEAVPADG